MALSQETLDTVHAYYAKGIQAAIDLRKNWSKRILVPINPDAIVGVGIVTLADNCADDDLLTGLERKCFTTGFIAEFKSGSKS